jgi:hypothetical protein
MPARFARRRTASRPGSRRTSQPVRHRNRRRLSEAWGRLQRSRSTLMMASTGVPPTGWSRAFANRFSGFHRAKTLIGGSCADGRQRSDRRASIAHENRSVLPGRSHPCAGTPVQLPDRDLLHVSHCHTRCSRRQAMAHRSRSVLSQLLGCSRGDVIVPWAVASERRATKSPIGSVEAKIPATAGDAPTQPLGPERQHRESWLGCVVSCIRGGAQKPQSHSRNRGTFSCTARECAARS